jgi:hypothetical protein
MSSCCNYRGGIRRALLRLWLPDRLHRHTQPLSEMIKHSVARYNSQTGFWEWEPSGGPH